MANDIKLRAPLQITGGEVERALFEQSMEELAVAQVFDRLRGVASGRAAEELNRALEIDIFEVLTEAWARIPAVSSAVHLSALVKGPPALVNVDRHDITSNFRIVLESSVGQSALPPLNLTLEIVATIESATLAAHEGRIELVALGDASIIARLRYGSVLLKEHATGISGASRDPFKRQPSATDRQANVDIQI
ncbi:MAG TPA: hypothetical protein VE421_12285 [Burkholderiaceae bacterium]|nr:hypothetical protein [Burkholderiaceae bacterium]